MKYLSIVCGTLHADDRIVSSVDKRMACHRMSRKMSKVQ